MAKIIYLDHAATTYLDETVLKEMISAMKNLPGNPSSLYSTALEAKEALDKAREKIAKIINAKTSEIIFMSGGTESDNFALKGFMDDKKGKHIVTTLIEHPAVYNACKYLESKGIKVTYLLPDKEGMISAKDVEKAITRKTVLVSVMYANNETGTINPIKEIAEVCKKHKIIFHTDACQAGLLNLDVEELGIDMMTLNAGKIYGPKGMGLLYLKQGTKITPLLHGGGQEFDLRSGTENVAGAIGFAKALELIQANRKQEGARLRKLSDKLLKGLMEIKDLELHGASNPDNRLPQTIDVSFKKVEGESLMLLLNEKGIEVSTGSACSSKSLKPSRILLASGCGEEEAHGSIRFSLGKNTTEEDIDFTIKAVKECVEKLRKISAI